MCIRDRDNDMFSELFGRGDAYDLLERVLYNTDWKACGYISDRRPVFLCLLNRWIHKYRAAGTKIDGIVGKQSERWKFFYRVSERSGKGLQKRTAPWGTGFVEKNVVTSSVYYFEAFYILTADIDYKAYVRLKFMRGGEMGDCFNNSVVKIK